MTILSYDNSGDIKFDVDIEMEQGYWNTSSSRLWTRLRDLMHNDIVATYNNMRQNGVSYENIMKYMYDEQIAKIPASYYNMDYDIKYAPFEDQYIGMAHGNGYEHMKRWLKNRFTFCDTLFDYAPSYNNDVLTIRANTTKLMNIQIETYTPVYQHMSWYNGQMDKKKIDGKSAVEFSGTAMASTDQEVLIYGGSNVKRITGITSMNPNQMLIGSATRLIELDASNSPLLADINSNKANLSPHIYLNKVNLSNCPLLGGNLRLNNSPLIQEVDMRGTTITGLNLPSSVRNLEVLRLPNTISDLTLNDAGMLHTLEFDEGVAMNNISMSNCNALENVINLDLLSTPTISLDNSYNSVAELYFKDTTNLTVRNMPNLERIIYTPNNEYETFELINVANALDYTITTFNCPKLSTFMTTAPYRESYNNGDYGDIQPNTTFTANNLDISNTQFTDVKLLCTTDVNTLKLPTTVKNFYCDSSFDLDTDYLEDGEYDVVHGELVESYTTDYASEVLLNGANPNLVPSSADGSLIFSMYTPSKTVAPASGTWDLKGLEFDNFHTFGMNNDVKSNDEIKSITMPARYDDYNITIKNAHISPKTHNTMLYPLLVNEDNPIEGILDYTNYTGKYLSWSFAYTDLNKVDITQPRDELLSSYEYRYNAFYDTEYEFNNPYEVARYTCSASGVLPTFNSEFTYTYDEINNGDGTYKTMVYADSLDNLPTLVNFSGNTTLLTVDYINGSSLVSVMSGTSEGLFSGCTNLTYFNTTGFDISGLTDFSSMFYNCNNLTTLDVSNFNTANVNDMNRMFYGCRNLTTLNVSNFNTSNVTNMNNMFYNCNNLTTLDVSNFNTSNVNDMNRMFYGCRNLTTLNVSNFNTSNVTNMEYMFHSCNNLITLDLSNFDTSNVTNMGSMFYNCTNLTTLDLSNFDTSNVTDITYMFYSCTNLISLNLEGWSNLSNIITQLSASPSTSTLYGTAPIDESTLPTGWVYEFNDIYILMQYTSSRDSLVPTFNEEFTQYTKSVTELETSLYQITIYRTDISISPTSVELRGSSYLKTLDVINLRVSDMSEINFTANTACTYMNLSKLKFDNLTTLQSLLSGNRLLNKVDGIFDWDTSKVTDMSYVFNNCTNLTSVDLSNWDTSNVTTMQNMFYSCTKLTTLDVSNFNTSNVTNMNNMFYNCNKLTSLDLSNFNTVNVTNMQSMFYNCTNLTTLDLSNFNTANVTTMQNMFYNCTNLTTLDLSNWDNSNVTNMNNMFYNCTNLTTLNVSNFNTANVTNMQSMFYNCNNLTTLDVSNFNTSNVTSMTYMFYGCTNLTTLNVSNFNTANVTNMQSMFYDCNKLTSLDLSSFNVSKVTTMQNMFYNCTNLTTLDLSNWDTSNVTNMNRMFYDCNKLTSLDLSSFNVSKVTNFTDIFYNTYNLVTLNSMQNINSTLSLSYATKLDINSLLDVIDNLSTVGFTCSLTLGTTNLAKLTEEQIAVAVNKGWNVS